LVACGLYRNDYSQPKPGWTRPAPEAILYFPAMPASSLILVRFHLDKEPSCMHHELSLITTIAAALGFGLLFGMLAVRLKLPALVGYLAAGIVIGPATPGFVADVGWPRNWPRSV
jgi:mannose/fructose/N-acetylgalactosamine-specific phosphotransferase system component IIC